MRDMGQTQANGTCLDDMAIKGELAEGPVDSMTINVKGMFMEILLLLSEKSSEYTQ